MGSQHRPSFFCSRPDGTLTPLIAVDDLPVTVSVRGVSRVLTPGETQGMFSCGVVAQRTVPWVVDNLASGSSLVHDEKFSELHELESLLFKVLREDGVDADTRATIRERLFRGYISLSPVSAPVPTSSGPVTRRGPQHVLETSQGGNLQGNQKNGHNKKYFCSYWIRHGECDYSQQGCLYKHEMPMDVELLERLGLRDIPRWYRDKYSVPSLLSTYGNNRGQGQYAITEHADQHLVQSPRHSIEWTSSVDTAENKEYRSKQSRSKAPKSPRGPGFGPGKVRGNNSKNRQPRKNIAEPGNVTPSPTSSSSTSGDSFVIPNASDHSPDGTLSLTRQDFGRYSTQSRNLLGKDGTKAVCVSESITKESNNVYSKNGFRTKSRRPFEYNHDKFGGDANVQSPNNCNPAGGNPATRPTTSVSANVSNIANPGSRRTDVVGPNNTTYYFVPSSMAPVTRLNAPDFTDPEQRRFMYNELLSNSESVHPLDMEYTYGPIGEPVQYPSERSRTMSSTSADAVFFAGTSQSFKSSKNTKPGN